jgi:hypothetical protein
LISLCFPTFAHTLLAPGEWMKEKMKNSGIVEELMAYIFHPKNMDKWIDWGFTDFQDYLDLNFENVC